MKYFLRHDEPNFLARNAARWNQQWANLRARNLGATFKWYKYNGQPVNQLLFPLLAAQTQDHCSYCDAFPRRLGDDTIDHFRPKGKPVFYHQSYVWVNLYASCGHCQRAKMEYFSDDLLWPDAEDYSFERYFVYNYTSHEIEINPRASANDQLKALETRRIFQFNHPGQIEQRKKAFQLWNFIPEANRFSDDFPYRFMFLEDIVWFECIL